MARTAKKFNPTHDAYQPFKLPTLFVVAEFIGPSDNESLYVLGGGIYTNREQAEAHAAELSDGDRRRTLNAKMALANPAGLTPEQIRGFEASLKYGERRIKVLETGKSCHIKLAVNAGPGPYETATNFYL